MRAEISPPWGHPEIWHVAPEKRTRLLRPMISQHDKEVAKIAKKIEKERGTGSAEAEAARTFAQLSTPLTTIAASLLEKGQQGLPWRQADPQAALQLEARLRTLKGSFQAEAELLLRLINVESAAEAEEINRASARAAKEKHALGLPAVILVLDDSYVNPHRGPDDGLSSFIPGAQLLFPPDQALPTKQLWEGVSAFHGKRKVEPPHIIGNAVMTAGTDVLSPTIGQGFSEGGFVLAVNLLRRRQASIESVARLLQKDAPHYESLVRLFVAHEEGHDFDEDFPGKTGRVLAELRCDAAAAFSVFAGNSEPEPEIVAFISDLCSSFAETLEDEGGVFSGYRISAVVLGNELFASGVLEQTGKEFRLNIDHLPDFLHRLEGVRAQLFASDEQLATTPIAPQTREFFRRCSELSQQH